MSETTTFPPPGPTVLPNILPAYVFQQFSDDENIQAFNTAFNQIAQIYQTWFVTINLPIYTSPTIVGPLLDWVAQGIYGISRPSLPYGQVTGIGLLATFMPAQIEVAQFYAIGAINQFTTTDDIFKRIITWFFFKGDGQVFCTTWLKRRIMRFLTDPGGSAPNIDNTYPVSVVWNGQGAATITITLTAAAGITLAVAQIFQAAVQSGAISLPFQYSFTVDIVNNLGPTYLASSGGVLYLTNTTGWPTSPTGLPAGSVWSNGTVVSVVPGITPSPFAAPVYFELVTSGALLAQGGGQLPLTNPSVTNQLWNNGGVVSISE